MSRVLPDNCRTMPLTLLRRLVCSSMPRKPMGAPALNCSAYATQWHAECHMSSQRRQVHMILAGSQTCHAWIEGVRWLDTKLGSARGSDEAG